MRSPLVAPAMNLRPLVSIVTPCLDPGARLRRCLDSVGAQTYAHVEHLVLDGGSTDGTVELLRGRPGLQWVSEPDRGQTDAINKGVRRAQGEIVAWLNADDELAPDAVALVVEAFTTAPAPAWVYGDARVYDGVREWFQRPPAQLALADLDARNPIPQPACFVARWALERVGDLDERFDLVMDLDLWYRLLLQGHRPRYVPATLASIEVHADAKTRSWAPGAWAEEFGQVRLKHGRLVPAAIGLGRAAAHVAEREGRVDRRRLATEIARIRGETGPASSLPTEVLRAAASTEAAVIERDHPLLRWRHLASLPPWRCTATRELLLGVGRARAKAALGSLRP